MEKLPELPRVGRPVKMDAFHHVEEALARVRTKSSILKCLKKRTKAAFLRAFFENAFYFEDFHSCR